MLLAKYLGGSHLYGLNTPESDVDEREVFLNTDPAYILGTRRFDQEVRNNEKEDIHKVELRKFLELMRKGNTQSIEVLYAKEESFQYLSSVMEVIRKNRERLIDSDKLFKVVSSFIHAQKFLIFDDKRKAEKGSKRASKIDEYGYNPKAASTAVRLADSGIDFFKHGYYSVEVLDESWARFVKLQPEQFTANTIRVLVEEKDKALKHAYDNTKIKTVFDEDYANEILLECYLPYLLDDNRRM